MAESQEFREFIFQLFAARMVHLMTLMQDLAFHPLEQRMAAMLLAQGDTVELTHQQLADELGSVREVISRILKHFEARGAVRLDRRKIQIADRAALSQIAWPLGQRAVDFRGLG